VEDGGDGGGGVVGGVFGLVVGGFILAGVTGVLWANESRKLSKLDIAPLSLMSMFGGAAIADTNMVDNTKNKRTVREAITSELLRKK